MIDLYFWPTPNGHKITLMLEETGLDYTIRPINIGKGDQFAPDYLKISPNNKMPAIVDHEPGDGDQPGGGPRSASSNRARSCCTSPRRRSALPARRCASASPSRNGCSGRLAGSGR